MLTLYDEFAGWGGSSQGAAAVPGVELRLAANHARLAVEVHALNFPAADHYLGDVTKADVTRFPRADLFWSSPACPPFTDARGRKQYFDQATALTLFDDPSETPGARAARLDLVKRRALMEEVPRYLRAMAAKGKPVVGGVVENVVQVVKWDQFGRWRREIEHSAPQGYATRMIALNAMHARGRGTRRAPQSRDRFFLAYWLRSLGRTPDWDKWLRPRAWCPLCEERVDAVQVFKDPRKAMGRYGARYGQYVYRCPRVHGAWRASHRPGLVEPDVLPALAAIDLTLPPGARIGERVDPRGRPDPLEPATLARIEAGIRRHAVPITLDVGGHTFERRPGVRTWPIDAPLTTFTTTATRAVAVPPLMVPAGGTWRRDVAPVTGPMPSRTTRETDGLVVAPGTPVGDLVTWGEMLLPYYSTGTARPAAEPLGALTTRDRYALVGPGTGDPAGPTVAVEDCTFRMLAPPEIAAGMAFAADYKVKGTNKERIAGYGNAVCPPAAEVIVSALVEAITGEDLPR